MSSNILQPHILIGGITGGLGSALAKRLSQQGVQVSGFARDAGKFDALSAELPGAQLFAAEATDSHSVASAFETAQQGAGPLTGYAHCIGSILLKSAHQLSDEEWAQTIRLNLDSAFYALRAGVKAMQKQQHGSLVFVSTGAARAGLPAHEAIAAAKAGLEGLVRSAAASYATRGLRFNAVAPGMVETPLAAPILSTEAGRKVSVAMHPLGRVGQPDEIASLMAWLLSDEARWVSGETYSIDGGLAHLRQRARV